MKSKRKKIGSSLSKSVFTRFFGTLIIFTIITVVLFIATVFIFSLNIWYGNELIYRILAPLSYNRYLVTFLFWGVGCIIIFLYYWSKTLGYIDTLMDASKKLVSEDEDWIYLPDELNEVESQMNKIKQEAIRNRELAKESEERKNDLIVYLAHDIKTPLTSVIGYLSLLNEAQDMPDLQRKKYLEITLDKSYRLENLINELFDITRFNSEKIILEKEEINLNLMINQIIDEFYPILKEGNRKIEFNEKEKINIYADSDKMARVFNNIIKNAISYGYENTSIIIEMIKNEEEVILDIKNKGKKIPESKLSKIFEKFYRADLSRNARTGGSGLGLAIAKEIVKLHRGDISAKSDEEETCFSVTVPLK